MCKWSNYYLLSWYFVFLSSINVLMQKKSVTVNLVLLLEEDYAV